MQCFKSKNVQMLESMRVIDEKQKVERILIYSGDIKKPNRTIQNGEL